MVVMGNFNARTGTMQDFIDIDEGLEPSERTNTLKYKWIPVIDVCKTIDMMILNGRSGEERGVGNPSKIRYQIFL